MNQKINWLLAGAALTLVAGVAVAQDAKPNAGPGEQRVERRVIIQRGGPGGPEGPGEVRIMRMHGGDPAQRAEHLKTMLQLRPNQEGALKTYLEAMKPPEGMARMERREGPPPSTPERLDRMEKRMGEHQAQMKKRNDATRAFYAQLDASQKKVFDTMPMMMGGDHMKMAMGGPNVRVMRMGHGPMPPMPPMPPKPPEGEHRHD